MCRQQNCEQSCNDDEDHNNHVYFWIFSKNKINQYE